MFCGPTRPRAPRRPPFVREQVPAHEHRLPRATIGSAQSERSTSRRGACRRRRCPRPDGVSDPNAHRTADLIAGVLAEAIRRVLRRMDRCCCSPRRDHYHPTRTRT